MRRLVFSFVLFVFGAVVVGAATPESEPEKALIVYLSRANNTKVLAEIIHSYVGGDLISLELQKPYPENYGQIVQQVARENETGFLPPLKTEIRDIAQYDVIFVGFPTWGMQLPPPIKSFLKQYDLRGKRVAPFNSNAGYGLGTTFQTVRELCPNSEVLEGYSVKGGNERDGVFLALQGERAEQAREEIKRWLRQLALLKALGAIVCSRPDVSAVDRRKAFPLRPSHWVSCLRKEHKCIWDRSRYSGRCCP